MKQLEYSVRFNTPAFLGNAEQSGQWRTPPIKALLRQWWRVAYAAENGFPKDIAVMRRDEGLLFGHAWLEDDCDERRQKVAARKSQVRIRLDRWDEGKLKSWPSLDKVPHPEVKFPVGSDLYMGYGPVTLPKGAKQPALKANAAIQSGETATLSLAAPDEHAPLIEQALMLMDRYGTLGGRSRNGWGSFSLTPQGETPALAGEAPLRTLSDALKFDWPHAIGKDDTGMLAWKTKQHADWAALMKELAIIKISLRTQFKFTTGKNAIQTEDRHWLSYPVTNHSVQAWGNNARLPNSLRFKVRPAPNDPKQVVGVIFHVPCLPPPEFNPQRNVIVEMWQSEHSLLDELAKPASARGYGSVSDIERRAKLKPQLDSVSLTRIPE